MCQYNNIYKRKKVQTEDRKKKKDKDKVAQQNGTVALATKLGKKNGSLHQGDCIGIASFYIVSRKKSTNR